MNPPSLKAIAAVSLDRVIGKDGDLPWRLPEDLKWFKKITTGHSVLMGRKTWESLGRPLPNRRNLVLSRSMKPSDGMEVIRSIDALDALALKSDLFVIGGGEIYRWRRVADKFSSSVFVGPVGQDRGRGTHGDRFARSRRGQGGATVDYGRG